MKAKTILLFVILTALISPAYATATSDDDYNARQAKRYTKEAEYYQRKADSYRREAEYFLKKAESYQREAAYYTRKGDADRAKDYTRRTERAMDDYKTQMRHAADADEKAADYLRRAAKILRK